MSLRHTFSLLFVWVWPKIISRWKIMIYLNDTSTKANMYVTESIEYVSIVSVSSINRLFSGLWTKWDLRLSQLKSEEKGKKFQKELRKFENVCIYLFNRHFIESFQSKAFPRYQMPIQNPHTKSKTNLPTSTISAQSIHSSDLFPDTTWISSYLRHHDHT